MLRSLSVRWLVPVAALVLVLPGCGDSSSDIDTVEQLVDAHNQAWLGDDAEGVGAVYTDDGIFVDLAGVEIIGRDQIVEYAEGHVSLVSESRRTGPIEDRKDGSFLVPTEIVVAGRGAFTGAVIVTIKDDLFAHYDWFEGPTPE